MHQRFASTWSSMEGCSLLSFSKSSLAGRRKEEIVNTITNTPSFFQGCLPLLFAKLHLPRSAKALAGATRTGVLAHW